MENNNKSFTSTKSKPKNLKKSSNISSYESE
jgi:hypothetical protein